MKKLIFALAFAVTATPVLAQQAAPASDPVGGYQPTTPPPHIAPGQPFVYVQAPTPDIAFPPPAPLASYLVCKRGQYDKCVEPGGR